MKDAVWYKDGWLMPKSEAFELFHSKDENAPKKLAAHIKRLEAEMHARGDVQYKGKVH